jgi:hypothetical protein
MSTKTIFSLVFMLFAYVIQAQTNEVEIYTADSKLFTVYVDGVKINESPLSNVNFTSTKTENLDFKIVFAENATVLEKKGVQMISYANKSSYSNGARAVYQLINTNGTYNLSQATVTNRTSSNLTKAID